MSTKFLSPGWRMPRNANQSKSSNYSLNFDGSNFIEVPLTIDGSSSVTMSVWFKNNFDTQVNQYLLSFPRAATNNGFDINFNYQQVRSFLSGSSGGFSALSSTFTYTDGNWHHIAVSYDGTSHKMYIDGVLTALDSVSYGTINNNTGMFYIGAFNRSGGSPVGGIESTELNQVAVFDYALSDGGVSVGSTATGQIAQLYGTGSAIGNPMALPRTPIAYYPLGTSAWNGDYLAENNAIGDYVFDFDGGDNIEIDSIGSTISAMTQISVSAWIKTSSSSSGYILFAGRGSSGRTGYVGLATFSSGTVYGVVGGQPSVSGFSELTTTATVNDGNWHHLAMTFNNSNGVIQVYIDGSLDPTSSTTSGLIPTNIIYADIAQRSYNNDFRFNGEISNVQIFNTVLSGPEVETLYNYGSPIQTLANIPQNSNLKAWYKLDATEIYNSTSTEWSVDNNQNPSAYPSSLSFDGNDYIDYGNDSSLSPTSQLSVSVWVNNTGTGTGSFPCVISNVSSSTNNGGFVLSKNSNKWKFYLDTTGSSGWVIAESDGSVVSNVWQHLCVTWNGTTVIMYLNGQAQTTTASASQIVYNADTKTIIGEYAGSYFNGSISNVQIFNTALTDGTGGTVNQIETLYNSGNPLTDMSSFSSLVSWWKLDNTTTGIEDSKGSNNGTNNGATEAPGSVSTLNGLSSGMSQSNLVQSDLQTVAPYSKYAMSFDSVSSSYIDVTNFTLSGDRTVSFWVNFGQTPYGSILEGVDGDNYYPFFGSGNIYLNNDGTATSLSYGTVNANEWYHFCITGDGTTATVYKNGSSLGTLGDKNITVYYLNGKVYGIDYSSNNGKLSNIAIWNTVITSSQVREIYNEGLPSNLNTFSGTAPVAWWQLGENSSYASDWIFADEIGSNNGGGQNLPETALTNGVGTTANGVSSGMSEGSLVGDAPYSTANAISSGMPVTARGTDVPPTP